MKIYQYILWVLVFCSIDAYAQKDTVIIYKYGSFLFEASDTMKVDFIVKGSPLKQRISKGDTLYHDSKYIILGDASKRIGMGIYKRYKLKYKFESFKTSIYKGKLAAPDFTSDPSAKFYKTMIKTQCKAQGVNFAGHYTVIEWGCGTECENIAVVDRLNGRIYYTTIPYGGDEGYYGTKYKANSRMLIANSFNLDDHKGYALIRDYERIRILEWTGLGFKKLPR